MSGLKKAMRVGKGRTRIPAAKTRFAKNEIKHVAIAKIKIRFGTDFLFREKWNISVIERIRNK